MDTIPFVPTCCDSIHLCNLFLLYFRKHRLNCYYLPPLRICRYWCYCCLYSENNLINIHCRRHSSVGIQDHPIILFDRWYHVFLIRKCLKCTKTRHCLHCTFNKCYWWRYSSHDDAFCVLAIHFGYN